MIENLMYLGLGALLAGLAALLFLPLFWRRALRLSTRSLEMQLPLSMTEIVAERDQLRAEFAIEQRRIEKKAEDLTDARAKDMAELGRRAKHIAAIEAEMVELWRQSESRAERLASLGSELTAARAEIGVAHQLSFDAEGRHFNKVQELAELAGKHAALNDHANEQRASIAGLETRVAGHEATIEDLAGAHEDARRENLELSRAILAMEIEHAKARADAESNASRRDLAQAQAREAQERLQEIEREHRLERRARIRLEAELAAQSSALSIAETREMTLREGHAAELSNARGGDRELLQRIEDLRAENAALLGALDIARRDGPAAARGLVDGHSPFDDPAEAELLRRAIVEVGMQVAHLAGQIERRPIAGAAE